MCVGRRDKKVRKWNQWHYQKFPVVWIIQSFGRRNDEVGIMLMFINPFHPSKTHKTKTNKPTNQQTKNKANQRKTLVDIHSFNMSHIQHSSQPRKWRTASPHGSGPKNDKNFGHDFLLKKMTLSRLWKEKNESPSLVLFFTSTFC